jgi:lipoprotein-releasing system permease protein
MLKLFLWLRYLRKKKVVYLSVAAVALSVSLLIVVASLFTGFIDAFEQSAVETIGDVVIATPIKFAKYPLLIERLEQMSTIEAATAALSVPGLLHLGEGNVRAVEVWGIEPGRRARVTTYKQSLLKQKHLLNEPSFYLDSHSEQTGAFLGIGVIAEPNEETDKYDFAAAEAVIGQQIILTTGSMLESETSLPDSSDNRFKRRTMKLIVADVIFTGVYDLDKSFVYLPIEQLQDILYPNEDGFFATHIQIKLIPNSDPDAAVAQIRGAWQVFADEQLGWSAYLVSQTEIATARQMQNRYVVELRKQMGVLLLIFGVVSFSVIVLIFCIFYMIVRLKQKDIAIVKSCGASSSAVMWIFFGFGVCVGIVGSALGVILGYIVTKNVNTIEEWIRIIFGLKLWKSSVYMFSKIPNEVDWTLAIRIVLLAIIAAIVGTVIPAVVAAITKPVEILRYE